MPEVRVEQRRFPDGAGGSVGGVVAVSGTFDSFRDPVVVLAHGAGNDMHNPLLTAVQLGLAGAGCAVCKFNFPYKELGRRAPDRAPVLERCYRSVLEAVRAGPFPSPGCLVIGGKSMGGRVASHLAAEGVAVDGLLFLGYPLHPAGQPERLRSAHLPRITVPMLFFAGTRDPLCDLQLLRRAVAGLTAPAALHVVDGGDHSFDVPRRTGRSTEDVYAEIVAAAAAWVRALPASRTPSCSSSQRLRGKPPA